MKLKYTFLVGLLVLLPAILVAQELQTRTTVEAQSNTSVRSVDSSDAVSVESGAEVSKETESNTKDTSSDDSDSTSSSGSSNSRTITNTTTEVRTSSVEAVNTSLELNSEVTSDVSARSTSDSSDDEAITTDISSGSRTQTQTQTQTRVVPVETVQASLDQISNTLIDIDTESIQVESNLRQQIKEGLDREISKIRVEPGVDIEAYLLQRAVDETRTEAFTMIREQIRLNIPTTRAEVDALTEQLDVYVDEMEVSLENLSDIAVDLSATKENIRAEMNAFAEKIAEREINLEEVGADLINLDTDEDGLSDYDEIYIFNTDPQNTRTAGGDLTDAEKVSRGINPTSATAEPIDYEDPREREDIPQSRIYNVTRVELVNESGEVISSTTANSETPKRLRISGTGLPNSYITVYIFSTPTIVKVKTDSRGEWTYTLDKELENGEHEVHVATVDNSGKILAKSNAIPFTQTAEAAALGAFVGIGDDPVTGTGNFVQDNFVFLVIVIVLIGILITISLFGKKSDEELAKEELSKDQNSTNGPKV